MGTYRAVFQLVFFGKGSCNLQGGYIAQSTKVYLANLTATALCKAKGMSWGWGFVGHTDRELTFWSLKMFDI